MKKSNANTTQTIDGETGKVVDTPDCQLRKINLATLKDLRLEMRRVYLMVDGGKLADQDGSRRVYMLKQMADVIIASDIEQRLVNLEEAREGQLISGNSALEYRH